jgi:molybdopterin-guanine dinucleotide biosynthesis protein A
MIQHVIAALASVCERVVVNVAEAIDAASIDGLVLPDGRPVTIVRDRRPGLGAMVGVEALLASECGDEYLICACDTPLITPQLLRSLTHPTAAAAAALTFPGEDGESVRIEALPMRIARSALPVVRDHLDRGERALHRLLLSTDLAIDLIDAPAGWQDALRNVNTPLDHRRLFERPAAPHPYTRT